MADTEFSSSMQEGPAETLPPFFAGSMQEGGASTLPQFFAGSMQEGLAAVRPTGFAGPVLNESVGILPDKFSGPDLTGELAILPPIVQAPAYSGPTIHEPLSLSVPFTQRTEFAGPVIDGELGLLPVGAPVIEDPTVAQRDTSRTFLGDVNFRAWQNTGDALSLLVEWQRGGIAGSWIPATAQPVDRRHDPEGAIIRPKDRRRLEGYWRFEGGFADSGELGRDLTEYGTVQIVAGAIGNAARFAGNAANYLRIATPENAFGFGGDDDVTLEVTLRWADVANAQVVIEKFAAPQGPGWSLVKLANNRLQFHYGGPPGLLIETTNALAVVDGEWHRISVRRRNRVLKVLYDAVEQPLLATPPEPITPLAPATTGLVIGRRSDGTLPLNADVDEVSIFTRSLSNAEVSTNYNGGAGRILPGTATSSPGVRFNFVWDTIRDVPEGTFGDVFVRISVSNHLTTTVIVGPVSISTTTPTAEDTFARSLQRRALAEGTEGDFLGCGLTIPFRRASRDFESACGVNLIRSCVRQILGTRAAVGEFPGDLQWRPDFGNKMWILRHRNNDGFLREEAATFVQEALQFEPRVEVTEVVTSVNAEDPSRLDVLVRYRIIEANTLDNRVFIPEFEDVVTI